jgi:CheY-like chemotaxis protein
MRPRRILIMEDHADNREILTLALEAARFDVCAAADIASAVALIEARAFDVVLADLVIGTHVEGTAWDGFRRLRAAARPAPVGVMSGLTTAQASAEAEGAAFFLLKPFRLPALFEQLGRIFAVPLPAGATETVAAYLVALETGAWNQLVALCTEDVVYRLPGDHPGLSTTVHGRDAFRRLAEEMFRAFPDPTFSVNHVYPLPGTVVVDYVGSWRDGNVRRSAPGTLLINFRGGFIAEINVRAVVVALAGEPRRR